MFAILTVAFLCSPAFGQSANRYYGDRAKGWHFYAPEPPKPAKDKARKPLGPVTNTDAAPLPLSTAWLRDNIQKYMDRAMDDPSPVNLELYGLLQRMALDKADRFANSYTQQIASNPALDESARTAINGVGKTARVAFMTEQKKKVLTKLSTKAGLYFFFRSDCPYCHKQAPLLQMLQARYGLKILPISLDGGPLQTGDYPQYVVDNGQAAKLGVKTTPTLVLFQPPGITSMVSVNLRSLPELEQRLLDVGLTKNIITKAEYDDATRGAPVEYLEANNIPKEVLRNAGDNPKVLLSLLRNAAVSGGSSAWDGTSQ